MIAKQNARTFQNDLHLPALPYPSLKHSLSMYLDILDAIMPTHIFLKNKETISMFAIEDCYLLEYNHKKLKQRYKCWLEDVFFFFSYPMPLNEHISRFLPQWWFMQYHLTTDTELIPFNSITGISTLHEHMWPPDKTSSTDRAAQYIHGLLTLWSCLRQEIIVPERSENDEMLSMNTYRNVFNSGRVCLCGYF